MTGAGYGATGGYNNEYDRDRGMGGDKTLGQKIKEHIPGTQENQMRKAERGDI